MKTILIKNARVLLTMDVARREIANGAVYIRGNVIEQVGNTQDLPHTADHMIDAQGCVVMPGLVNTHHHMIQSLTRAVPAAQNAELFGWLKSLYPIWAGITPPMAHTANLIAMAELMLSGCTTSSDHWYMYPNGCRLDDSIEAAHKIGIRFHAARGAMSVGESQGGLPPDSVVEKEDFILRDMQRLVEHYHDAQRHSMLQIVLAPCSPFTVSDDLMVQTAKMARALKVRLHTHLAENDNDIAYSLERYGKTPAQYVEDLEWVGHDVWHAHCVKLDEHGINLFGKTGTGIAHCPCSNMRLASGIAPIGRLLAAKVPVGLGVDGSASNDGAHLLGEARQAMLLQRVAGGAILGPAAMSARGALELATLGGAKVLGRDDIGALAAGMSADVVMFDTNTLDFAGALHDPVAALVFCTPAKVKHSLINGRVVVQDGRLTTLELAPVIAQHNQNAQALIEQAR